MNKTYKLTMTDADGITVTWFFVRAGGEVDPARPTYSLTDGEALIAAIRAAASQADFSAAQEAERCVRS